MKDNKQVIKNVDNLVFQDKLKFGCEGNFFISNFFLLFFFYWVE